VDAFFTSAWNFVCNIAGLAFLLWLVGQALRGMFRGGK
jgi:hypothetical protein